MKIFKWALAASAVSMMVACGGGGGSAGSSPFGGSGCSAASAASCQSAAASVDVLASSVQVGTGGDTSTISAVVKDSNNVGLKGVAVSFSASSGNLTAASAVTDASGVATATFTAGANRSNRPATVTVRSGSATGQIVLSIVGTVVSYSGVTTVPLNSTPSLSIKAVDSKNAPIAGLAVTVASTLGNGLSASTLTTDALGTASVTYTASTAGADTLTFTGGGSAAAPTLQVSAANFTFVTPVTGAQIPVTTASVVTVSYLSGNVPQSGKLINFSATAGVVSPTFATTNAAGQASVTITSQTASPAVIQASVSGVAVQATVPVVFVALAPSKLVLQVSPTAIGPNPSGTNSQAALVATVTDINGNPVSGATVTFNRLADPSGGNLSQASSVTDANGQATVQYIAGASTTASNGVRIEASILGTPSVFGDAQLTVNQSALFIALGTGNVIGNLDPQTYKKDWVVYVTDSSGVAVPNVSLTIKLLPIDYRKGTLIYNGSVWTYNPNNIFICQNEDKNYNGILDVGAPFFEDFNGDGKLEPGNVIAVTTAQTTTAASSGIAKTGADGRAAITLLYAESYVPWVKVMLVAQAIVSGTESSTTATFIVEGLASDFTSATNPPAGTTSPFGVNDCATPN